MANVRLRIVLGMFVLCSMAPFSRPAQAEPITIDFSFTESGTTVASGSFTYDSSLQGQSLSYSSLSAFNIQVLGGTDYDLNYVETTPLNDYNYFDFNTANDTFVGRDISSYYTLIAAVNTSYTSGFYVGGQSPGDPSNYVYDYSNSKGSYYDTVVVTNVVPEPSSLALIGVAGSLGLVVARARRRRPVA